MKFDSIQAGGVYFTVTKQKAGNTTMNTVAVHRVRVISTDTVRQTVEASWNSNQPKTFYHRDYKNWRASEPLLVGTITKRLATRAEIAAHKASKVAA